MSKIILWLIAWRWASLPFTLVHVLSNLVEVWPKMEGAVVLFHR